MQTHRVQQTSLPKRWLGAAVLAAALSTGIAQTSRGYIMQTLPYPAYSTPETSAYNLKWGKMIARVHASTQMEYNDNINLSELNPRSDFSISPNVGVGFMYPVSKNNLLQLDLGVGYRWYLNSPAVSSIILAPNSRLDYRVFINDLSLNFYDNISVQADPVSRPEISGAGAGDFINFRRLHNLAGVIAEWRPFRQWGFVGGYSHTLDRSLTSEYLELDYDQHTFSLGAMYQASSRLMLGLNNAYAMTFYRDSFQNDGTAFNIGPFVTWEATRFILLDASVAYSLATYDTNNRIADASDFQGLVFQVGVRHRINRRMNQNLRVGRTAGLGFGSNYTEMYSLQHGFQWQLNRAMSVNTLFSYENFQASNVGGDSGNRYMAYVGFNYSLTRTWNATLAYSYALKDSAIEGRDYSQNRLTLELQKRF
ncbi:hypothetical protein NXS98_15230 [Fontisphaera persica]|uniref:hypothetical protein n=1 Tax=Fontisphaera persica TaxID=2974023 RepID=UPI0024C04203|nr:hypothetical protein [Fontisphaera persica]WCJ59051.1 hypothetical protein NXS98_15230 [Fontisphaera persica]